VIVEVEVARGGTQVRHLWVIMGFTLFAVLACEDVFAGDSLHLLHNDCMLGRGSIAGRRLSLHFTPSSLVTRS